MFSPNKLVSFRVGQAQALIIAWRQPQQISRQAAVCNMILGQYLVVAPYFLPSAAQVTTVYAKFRYPSQLTLRLSLGPPTRVR